MATGLGFRPLSPLVGGIHFLRNPGLAESLNYCLWSTTHLHPQPSSIWSCHYLYVVLVYKEGPWCYLHIMYVVFGTRKISLGKESPTEVQGHQSIETGKGRVPAWTLCGRGSGVWNSDADQNSGAPCCWGYKELWDTGGLPFASCVYCMYMVVAGN